jgi:exosortase D (VPLPA-CTERM-specific)
MNAVAMAGPGAPQGLRVFKLPVAAWVVAVLALIGGAIAFETGIAFSATWIMDRPEYSHGMIIPFIAAFLVWQRKDALERVPFTGSWLGLAILVLAVAINLVGKLAALFIVQQYSVVIAFYGLVLALVGWRAFKVLSIPLLILLFMVPLPEFLFQNLSAQLQLVSSKLGVMVIRGFGISVFLEGNVIDLGVFKLQVADACSGLRYLFPLMTLAFIMAYFFQAAFWKRALLFLSSIPITILMNSFRIGVIGITVEHWGIGMAEGFLHEFQGWAVFMASTGLMLLEIVALTHIGRERRPWREVFGLEFPAPTPAGAVVQKREVPASFIAACLVLLAAALAAHFVPERVEAKPARQALVGFPNTLGNWHGRQEAMEQIYLDQLMLDDYLMANYADAAGRAVNFYVAWYDSQRAGRSAHSPRTCLPGGGWEMESFSQRELPGVALHGVPVRVNRVQIALRGERQLVYYFFAQRGRIVTNEYAVKWYLFVDSLFENRTDGALVRLTIPVRDGESVDAADARLTAFAKEAVGKLEAYVPGA